MEKQVRITLRAVAETGEPSASLKKIYAKVLEYNERLELGYVVGTLKNSIRRAIYEHLGDDKDGVFVKDRRGYYRLSIKIVINAVVHADAWKFVKLLPDESLPCIVTDPPWTALDRHRAWGTTTRMMQREWFETKDIDEEFVKHLARVLQKGRHAYLFHPALNEDTALSFGRLVEWITNAGLTFKKAIVWDKKTMGMGYCYRYQYELVLFVCKGKMQKLKNLGISDVRQFGRVSKKDQVHDCQKPVELVKLLISQSTDKGELVADFFAGSGTTGRACKELGRKFLMVDIGLEWVEQMKELKPAKVLSLV